MHNMHLPNMEPPMQPHRVAIADHEDRPECGHSAYLDPAEDWNGWACPYFERAEVERMAAWLPEFDDSLVYDEESDAFRTTYDPDLVETFSGTDIDGRRLYPIGAGSWTWIIVDENSEESTADASADAATKVDERALD